MGGAGGRFAEDPDKFMTTIVMPIYYIPNVNLSSVEMGLVTSSWKLITDDTSVEFTRVRDSESGSHHPTCLAWFSSAFTTRLFDIHPLCKPLFPAGLDNCILSILSVLIMHIDDAKAARGTLCDVALRHSERGVRPMEYGVVGDVLFWCVRLCIGTEAYTPAVHSAWVKFMSTILQVVVPVAVSVQGETEIERSKYKTDITVSCEEF